MLCWTSHLAPRRAAAAGTHSLSGELPLSLCGSFQHLFLSYFYRVLRDRFAAPKKPDAAMPCSTPQYFFYEDQQHANSSALKPQIADRHTLIDETTVRRSTSVQNWTFHSCVGNALKIGCVLSH